MGATAIWGCLGSSVKWLRIWGESNGCRKNVLGSGAVVATAYIQDYARDVTSSFSTMVSDISCMSFLSPCVYYTSSVTCRDHLLKAFGPKQLSPPWHKDDRPKGRPKRWKRRGQQHIKDFCTRQSMGSELVG